MKRKYVRKRRRSSRSLRRRRTYRPKRRIRRKRKSGFSPPTFPRSKAIAFRYVRSFDISSAATANVFSVQNWLAGSLYNPLANDLTAQPLGYDLWKSIYNQYRVYACKFSYTVTNNTTSPIYMTLQVTSEPGANVPQTLLYLARSIPGIQVKRLAPAGAPGSTGTLTKTFKLRTIQGVTAAGYEDDQYSSVFTDSPATDTNIYSGIANSQGNTAETRGDFTMTLYTKCFDREGFIPNTA